MTIKISDYINSSGELKLRGIDFDQLTEIEDDSLPDLKQIVIEDCWNLHLILPDIRVRPESTDTGVIIAGGSGTLEGMTVLGNLTGYGYDVRGSWILNSAHSGSCRINHLLRHMNSGVYNSYSTHASEDNIRVMSGFTEVVGCVVEEHTEYYPDDQVHKDCIQLAAFNYGTGSELDNPMVSVTIRGNYCISDYPTAQGIIMTDGVLISSEISENYVRVPSAHGLTVNRAQGCNIFDNDVNEIRIGSRKKVDNTNQKVKLYNNKSPKISVIGDSDIDEYGNSSTVQYV